jgi:glyoxylase-like metal-dependent hydrolase (beta-lactamase superfamily II)
MTHAATKQSALWLAAALGLSACGAHHTPAAPPIAPEPIVHIVTASPAGILVNAYLIEAAAGVVAVDSALTVSDARALRAALDALHKPLLAVLLTHGHPDHYNGVSALIEGLGKVPVYATPEVSTVITGADAAKEAQWKPMFGDEWPARRTFPDHLLASGEALEIGGLRFSVHAVGPGESHADSYWRLEGNTPRVFLGDIVLYGEHAFVSDGHTSAWLATLARLSRELGDVRTFYPGHGRPGGPELLQWQADYLRAYRAQVETLRAGLSSLSDEQKQALSAHMKALYPEAGIDFLIALGADAVATELAREH